MGDAIGSTLGFAVGIAISPIPIAAVILMLFSGRARSNSVAFMVAWIAGIAVVTTIVMLDPRARDRRRRTSEHHRLGQARSSVSLLLAVGVRQWRTGPGPDDETTVPAGWRASTTSAPPPRSDSGSCCRP